MIAHDLKTKPELTIASPSHKWSATVLETDGGAVPYSDARACIQLRQDKQTRATVALGAFRTLGVQWINDRLLYVWTDVGHIAIVGQLLDVDEMKWLYAQTQFTVFTEPSAAP